MRIKLGEVFQLKTKPEKLRSELIPSFDSVLESWVKQVRITSYADPTYFLEVTYLTEPLKIFVEKIVSNLESTGVFGGLLERGFGFGKTHSLILLWHLFTTNVYKELGIGIKSRVVKETLVLGIDFSKEKPFTRIIAELETYRNMEHPITKLKDPRLVQAVSRVLESCGRSRLYSLSSDELADLIVEILEKYSEFGGCPRLLILIDELGYGLEQRMRRYADYMEKGRRGEAEEVYAEANSIVNFLSYLYERLQGKPYSSVIIWVVAEQDRRGINALLLKYQDRQFIYSRIKGLLEDLDSIGERYSRGLGGTGIAELSYSPEHALEIAMHRILKSQRRLGDVREAYISILRYNAGQLNLGEWIEKYKEELRKYYPFSLGMIRLLRKLMNSRDVPGTEYVRTVIYVAAEAARDALIRDALNTYTISVKHLSLPEIVQAKLMGELAADWIQAVSDVEIAFSKLSGELKASAEMFAKYVFAKGVTANILAILESEDAKELERYGSLIEEVQVEIIQAFRESDSFRLLEKLGDALERLRAESARIDEKEVDGNRYYLPSFFRTIYSRLTAYIVEERKSIENKAYIPIYIKERGTTPSLFTDVRVVVDGRQDDVSVALLDFSKVWSVDTLVSDPAFQEAQNKGKLLMILVPPWDMSLYSKLYMGDLTYDNIVEGLANRLQKSVDRGSVKRPLHIIILLPNLSKNRFDRVLDRLAVYEGTKRFIDYLSRTSDVLMERLREYEDTLVKRKDLLEIINREVREKHLAKLRSKLEREIMDAKVLAQRQLLRLSREIVSEILSLYAKAIYYSLDSGRFVSKNIAMVETPSTTEGVLKYKAPMSLNQYASILNGFLRSIVFRLNYQHKPLEIMKVVLQAYRKEFEEAIVREKDVLDEVLENLMLGTYGVKPLSLNVALEAVKYLDKQVLEYDDKSVEIRVDTDKRVINFVVTLKKVEEKPPQFPVTPSGPKPRPVVVTRPRAPSIAKEVSLTSVYLVLPVGFNVDDLQQMFTVFLEHVQASISELSFHLDLGKAMLNYTLREVSLDTIRDSRIILNMLSRLSLKENRVVEVVLSLSEPVLEERVKEVFGEYYSGVKRSFDKFLP